MSSNSITSQPLLRNYAILLFVFSILIYSCETDLPVLMEEEIEIIDTLGQGDTIPNPMDSIPTDTIPNPMDTIPEPMDTIPEPMDTVPEPMDTIPEPMDTVPEPMDTIPEPMDTVPEPMDTIPEPMDTVPEPMDTIPEPMDTIPEPMDTVPEPMDTIPEPMDSIPIGEGLPPSFENGIFIVNEGQFLIGNSSLDFYVPQEDRLYNDVYQKINGETLGDVFQSLAMDENNLYLIINNSGKVEVVDRKTLKKKGTITGLPSPRQMVYSGAGDLWYVSNLFSDSLFIIDVAAMTIVNKIFIDGSTDPLLKLNGKLYMGLPNTTNMLIKQDGTNEIETIEVSKGASSIVADKDNNVWLLCYGDFNQTGGAAIFKINATTNEIEKEIKIASGLPSRLVYSQTTNALYYLNNDVFKLGISDTEEPAIPHILSYGRTLYGVNVDETNNELYVTDAVNFVEQGFVYRYTIEGANLDTIPTGIVPNGVYPIFK